MAQTILIKRSTSTATPTALSNGELAYSASSNKLFVGRPGGGSGDIDAIGGKYYTDIIDTAASANTASKLVLRDGSGNFAAGTITATLIGNVTGNLTGNASGSALTVTQAAQTAITSLGTLTALQVDNLNVNGNTILASSGALNLTPATGSAIVLDGTINVDAGVVTGATSITSTSFVGALTGNAATATKWATARNLSLTGDATATLSSVDGTAAVSAALTLATVNSNVGSFGSTTAIPVLTVNAKGLVTAASTVALATTLNITGDSGSDGIALLSETLNFTGDTGITTTVSSNDVSIDLNDTAVTPASYGSATAIPTFTVDQQGRLTAAGSASVATTLNITGDSGSDAVALLSETLDFEGSTGVTTTVSDDKVSIAIGQAVGTSDNVTFNNVTVNGVLNSDDVTAATMTASGNVVVQGNLTVNGTTTTVNSNTVAIGDSIMLLNNDETGTPSENAGLEVERGTSTNVSILWNEGSDYWQINDGSTTSKLLTAGNFAASFTGILDGGTF
jgi:hypothetical protein